MKRRDLQELGDKLMEEIVRRRKLGGYNADAATLEMLAVSVYELTRHLLEKAPREKPSDTDPD